MYRYPITKPVVNVTIRVFLIPFILCIFCCLELTAQSWVPLLRNESGDTVPYTYPPPETSYSKNSIIIKFRANGLQLGKLCYPYWIDPKVDNKSNKLQTILPFQRQALYAEQFQIDSIVTDLNLRSFMKLLGGIYLKRITIANPCKDTLTIARNGDTLRCTDYLWMTLHTNNDTSVINLCTYMTMLFQNSIEFAEPNYYISLDRIPNDPRYSSTQNGLKIDVDGIGAERAWDFQVGNYAIKCGVVDDGIDWQHCDLGGARGVGQKVVDGWNFGDSNNDFRTNSSHGTPVAGIIGARTNRGCINSNEGVAGIAGGWGPTNGQGDEGIGVQLYGFRIDGMANLVSAAIGALREGSAYNPNTGYGYGVHILNNSWGIDNYSESLRGAVSYAFEHGVSVTASRGNLGLKIQRYPGTYEQSWISTVGVADTETPRKKRRWRGLSNFGLRMDCIAPGRCDGSVITVQTCKLGGGYQWFQHTSAATPHVSGTIALLRSEALENGWILEPEDYQGIVNSSCERQNSSNNYDEEDGWGFLRLDRIFDRLQTGYRVSHFNSTSGLTFDNWSSLQDWAFINDGRTAKPILSGNYKVRIRKVRGSITLPTNKWIVNTNEPLYVWGRSSQSVLSGFSNAQPNYQTGYTEVISGVDGNLNEGMRGLRHSIGSVINIVSCETYQYEVRQGNNIIGIFPPDNQIRFNISVFGREANPSTVEIDKEQSSIMLSIMPNPSRNKVNIEYSLITDDAITITIIDAVGNVVMVSEQGNQDSGSYKLSLPVDTWSSGVYYCILSGKLTKYSKIFTVVH